MPSVDPRPRVDVRPAVAADRDDVVRVLARAFADDPLACFAVRGDGGKAAALATVFDVAFRRWTLPAGGVWIAEGGPGRGGSGAPGVALWAPPGAWHPLRAWPEALRLGKAVGWTRIARVLRGIGRVDRKHPREPHWYLFAVGVDPDHQGRGVGSALLHAALAECDRQGAPAYLEASTEANARLYARHGFRLVEAVDVEDGGPTARLMWRDARR
ncbi:MAG TPA: GNAT family N-acetyltransferase [Polyangiaceae bacterium]